MKRRYALLATLLLSACGDTKPERVLSGSNADVRVHRLTTWDDCVLYRIKADNTSIYVARCGDRVTATEVHSESCGKGCTRQVRVEAQTVEVRR